MNTGVQRMVRGLFAALDCRTEVMPLLWSSKLNSYCRLSTRELQFLVQPFARHSKASAKPEALSAPFPWSKAVRHLRHRKRRFALDAAATRDDVLFVPEIFQDHRVEKFRAGKAGFPGRSYAVFHDAIALRLPEFTAPERQRRFPDYVRALASFDKVLCVSREVEADLRFFWNSFGVATAPTARLGWPIDFGQPRPAPQPNFNARRALYVATLERRKNHVALLKATEKLWSTGLDFELILVGRTTADWGATVLGEVDHSNRKPAEEHKAVRVHERGAQDQVGAGDDDKLPGVAEHDQLGVGSVHGVTSRGRVRIVKNVPRHGVRKAVRTHAHKE